MHNIPDDCINNPLAPWNEKRQHPGDVFELAAKDNFDALDHIADHAKLWLGDEVVAMCFREAVAGKIMCDDIGDEIDRFAIDCAPIGVLWIGADSWIAKVAREAIGESIKENCSGSDLAALIVACAQVGKGKLSPEFPRDDFDNWQDMCQKDWEANS